MNIEHNEKVSDIHKLKYQSTEDFDNANGIFCFQIHNYFVLSSNNENIDCRQKLFDLKIYLLTMISIILYGYRSNMYDPTYREISYI